MSSLFAFPKQRALDNSGRPLPGARLYFYENLTSTPKNVYSDAATNTPHTNPVIADSHGQFPAIWLDGVYTVKLTTSANVEQWTVDDVSGPDETIFPETDDEVSAGIPPVDTDYPPGDLRRLGALGGDPSADSEALQNALILGGNIMVEKGYDFDCSGVVQHVVAQDIRIYGGGTLSGLAGTYLLKPAGGNIVIEDVIFDTWGGIVESDVTDNAETTDLMRIQNAQFYNMDGSTIDHERPINNCIIEGCIFDVVSDESVRIGKNTAALQDTWKRITIRNNRWTNVTANTADSGCGAIVYGREVDIDGNYVNGVTVTGTGEAWGFYTKARMTTIRANRIFNISGAAGVAKVVGINDKGSERGDVLNPNGFNTIIAHNYLESVGGYSIRAQCDETLIDTNIIEAPGDTAISLDGQGSNVSCIGNKAYVATEGATIGIRCSWNGDAVNMVNNTLEGFHHCIRIANAAGETSSAMMALQNTLKPGSTGAAIALDPNATGTIAKLILRGNKVPQGATGFIMPSSGTCSNLVVEHNDLSGATTKISGSLPTGARVRFNTGYVTENGGTSAGKATGGTIAHGLVAAPTVFNVVPQAALATDVYVTADATNLTVTFGGGGTVAFAWEAKTASHYA